jgi:hypothetical protein
LLLPFEPRPRGSIVEDPAPESRCAAAVFNWIESFFSNKCREVKHNFRFFFLILVSAAKALPPF